MKTNLNTSDSVSVWDPLVRIFHWSLVLFFLLAYVSEDEFMGIHAQAGYVVILLVIFRLFWGVFGSKPARFSSFVSRPSTVIAHLREMFNRRAPHYLGHNPVAAVMVVALLVSLLITSFTGLLVYAGEGQGPLVGTMFSNWRGDWVEELHEFFANFTVLLVVFHVTGVMVSSLLESENLVKAMITGRKRKREHWADFENTEVQ